MIYPAVIEMRQLETRRHLTSAAGNDGGWRKCAAESPHRIAGADLPLDVGRNAWEMDDYEVGALPIDTIQSPRAATLDASAIILQGSTGSCCILHLAVSCILDTIHFLDK